jgi:hypothetical protein
MIAIPGCFRSLPAKRKDEMPLRIHCANVAQTPRGGSPGRYALVFCLTMLA